jgi:hypothetical protein
MFNHILFFSIMLRSLLWLSSVSYKKNTINIQIILQKCVMKPAGVHFIFYSAHYGDKIPSYRHNERYRK